MELLESKLELPEVEEILVLIEAGFKELELLEIVDGKAKVAEELKILEAEDSELMDLVRFVVEEVVIKDTKEVDILGFDVLEVEVSKTETDDSELLEEKLEDSAQLELNEGKLYVKFDRMGGTELTMFEVHEPVTLLAELSHSRLTVNRSKDRLVESSMDSSIASSVLSRLVVR